MCNVTSQKETISLGPILVKIGFARRHNTTDIPRIKRNIKKKMHFITNNKYSNLINGCTNLYTFIQCIQHACTNFYLWLLKVGHSSNKSATNLKGI